MRLVNLFLKYFLEWNSFSFPYSLHSGPVTRANFSRGRIKILLPLAYNLAYLQVHVLCATAFQFSLKKCDKIFSLLTGNLLLLSWMGNKLIWEYEMEFFSFIAFLFLIIRVHPLTQETIPIIISNLNIQADILKGSTLPWKPPVNWTRDQTG